MPRGYRQQCGALSLSKCLPAESTLAEKECNDSKAFTFTNDFYIFAGVPNMDFHIFSALTSINEYFTLRM